MKNFLKNVAYSKSLKIAISVGLIVLIFLKINVGNLKDVLVRTNLLLYGFSLLLFFFQQVVIAYSWQILLKAQGNRVSFLNLLRVYFIGSFFGTFLPSSVGMDVVRIYGLTKHLEDSVDSASSMVVARILGFVILILFAIIAAIPMSFILKNNHLFVWIVLLSLIFLGVTFFVLSPVAQKIIYFFTGKLHLDSIESYIKRLYHSIYEFSGHKKALFQLVLISVFFQVLGIYIIYLIGQSLGIPLSPGYYFLLIPIVTVITLIPISVAGIGVREGSFIYFFSQVGVESVQALSLSFLVFLQWILVALLGGAIYLLVGFSRTPNTAPLNFNPNEKHS